MHCEVCGGVPVVARVTGPRRSYYVDWSCQQLAEVIIIDGKLQEDWWLTDVPERRTAS